MSILDGLKVKDANAIEKVANSINSNSKELDPKRFDMCIVVPFDVEGYSKKIEDIIPQLVYLSNICSDFEICRFTSEEISTMQIGSWMNIAKDNDYLIIEFSAWKLRYTKFIINIALLMFSVFKETKQICLFWSVGGGFLGDYRWKRMVLSGYDDVLQEIWQAVEWNIETSHIYDKIATFFKSTASHKANDDMDVYSTRSVHLVQRVRDNKNKRKEKYVNTR